MTRLLAAALIAVLIPAYAETPASAGQGSCYSAFGSYTGSSITCSAPL